MTSEIIFQFQLSESFVEEEVISILLPDVNLVDAVSFMQVNN